jgi:hypothetical protein
LNAGDVACVVPVMPIVLIRASLPVTTPLNRCETAAQIRQTAELRTAASFQTTSQLAAT